MSSSCAAGRAVAVAGGVGAPLLLLLAMLALGSAADVVTIFGQRATGGLWAARIIDNSKTGSAKLITRAGYPNLGVRISKMSYDTETGQVLLQMNMDGEKRLAYGPVCIGSARNQPEILGPVLSRGFKHPVYGDCLGCDPRAVSLYDSRIFYLTYGSFFLPAGGSKSTLQLRELTTCGNCDTEDESDMFECSKLVNEPQSAYLTEAIDVTLTDIMRVVKTEEGLGFLFQLFYQSEEGLTMDLVYLPASGPPKMLYAATDIDSRNAGITGIGDVSYKDGTLCWTATTKLYCGDFDLANQNLENVQEIIKTGEALLKGLCQAKLSASNQEKKHTALMTGVEVVRGGNRPKLVVGCLADNDMVGGSGFINIVGKRILIKRLSSDDAHLQAGSVFAESDVPSACPAPREPLMCPPKIRPTLPPATEAPTESSTDAILSSSSVKTVEASHSPSDRDTTTARKVTSPVTSDDINGYQTAKPEEPNIGEKRESSAAELRISSILVVIANIIYWFGSSS